MKSESALTIFSLRASVLVLILIGAILLAGCTSVQKGSQVGGPAKDRITVAVQYHDSTGGARIGYNTVEVYLTNGKRKPVSFKTVMLNDQELPMSGQQP